MAEINVVPGARQGEERAFTVTVIEGRSESVHRVRVLNDDLERLAYPGEPAEDFVRRCFDFLLAREPKEAILADFDVAVISRYFPEFEQEITA